MYLYLSATNTEVWFNYEILIVKDISGIILGCFNVLLHFRWQCLRETTKVLKIISSCLEFQNLYHLRLTFVQILKTI
jgi:hypothetical protein